jgi:predicted nicotinamide N-methyase
MSIELWLSDVKAQLPSDADVAREELFKLSQTLGDDAQRAAVYELMLELAGDAYRDYKAQRANSASASHGSFVDRELKPFELALRGGQTLTFAQRSIADVCDLGNAVWEGAVQLCRWLEERPALVREKRVLELGAGCGACGLVAGCLGASEVLLTDMSNIVPLLESNVAANRDCGVVAVAALDWTESPLPDYGSFDVVLAADCIYVHSPLAALVDVLQKYAKRGATILFAFEQHDDESVSKFMSLLAARQMSVQTLRPAERQRVNIVQIHLC